MYNNEMKNIKKSKFTSDVNLILLIDARSANKQMKYIKKSSRYRIN